MDKEMLDYLVHYGAKFIANIIVLGCEYMLLSNTTDLLTDAINRLTFCVFYRDLAEHGYTFTLESNYELKVYSFPAGYRLVRFDNLGIPITYYKHLPGEKDYNGNVSRIPVVNVIFALGAHIFTVISSNLDGVVNSLYENGTIEKMTESEQELYNSNPTFATAIKIINNRKSPFKKAEAIIEEDGSYIVYDKKTGLISLSSVPINFSTIEEHVEESIKCIDLLFEWINNKLKDKEKLSKKELKELKSYAIELEKVKNKIIKFSNEQGIKLNDEAEEKGIERKKYLNR